MILLAGWKTNLYGRCPLGEKHHSAKGDDGAFQRAQGNASRFGIQASVVPFMRSCRQKSGMTRRADAWIEDAWTLPERHPRNLWTRTRRDH